MVTGQVPYDADTPLGVLLKHVNDPLPSPRTLNPDLPQPVEDVIVRAMAKEPGDRFQSVSEMIQALTDSVSTDSGAGPIPDRPAPIRPQRAPTPNFATPPISRTPSDELPAFIAGPPIIHPGRFFGRERELKRIFNLLKQTPLQNAAIVGPRRSGKTSLLHYLRAITTAQPAQLRPGQKFDWLSPPLHYQWVLVDFQNPHLGTRAGLLSHILGSLNWPIPQPCDLDRFLETMSANLHSPTIIMFDEVGVALQRYRAELDDAFWEGLRSFATNSAWGNLAFILAAHEPPEQLARFSALGSPFFNIFGYTAALGPLSEPEARALISSSPISFPDSDTAWILEHSGRWPILLQILCRERLVTLEEGEATDAWREDGLKQMAPFKYLLD
jgi:hypothetical protein